ncbi:MAG: hypothetical protein GTO53_13250 [Planctomycetales bacterium]|nr:hypothetical protein [Planctomycetales bacterium]NIM10061.1 hypothetical protein [Planctomycetales bacterium]NIN09502.1 hypothetical protein [Planctomycetales bacterium]NIN78613.1 hypothetical protein [Planctomycetales bacterium]NIO35807.1 hypothetical protein [Planctomycetales bacterium]
MAALRYLFYLTATLLLLITAGPLLAGPLDADWVRPAASPPWLSAIHPGIFALFQLLASLTALVAFPSKR